MVSKLGHEIWCVSARLCISVCWCVIELLLEIYPSHLVAAEQAGEFIPIACFVLYWHLPYNSPSNSDTNLFVYAYQRTAQDKATSIKTQNPLIQTTLVLYAHVSDETTLDSLVSSNVIPSQAHPEIY